MNDFYRLIKLEKRIVKDYYLYLTNLPCPPQLKEALGYFDGEGRVAEGRKSNRHVEDAEIIGVWHDNHKITISDGYQTFTAANPGWDKYCNHPEIADYLRQLHYLAVDLYGNIDNYGTAEYGLAIIDNKIYLAKVKVITMVLQRNSDTRPDWIKNIDVDAALNFDWQEKYLACSKERNFPKYSMRAHNATKQMLDWLENRN